jgi:ankyrin repeat protein
MKILKTYTELFESNTYNIKVNMVSSYVQKGNLEKVKVSIKDINESDITQYLTIASYYGHLNIVEYLIKNYDIDFNFSLALKWAAQKNNFDIVKYLIENIQDININISTNFDEDTSLISAAKQNFKMVKYLIDHDADWSIKNNENKDFMDYLTDEQKKELKVLYPKKYKNFIIKKNIFNL